MAFSVFFKLCDPLDPNLFDSKTDSPCLEWDCANIVATAEQN
jgi:hypothetical protein